MNGASKSGPFGSVKMDRFFIPTVCAATVSRMSGTGMTNQPVGKTLLISLKRGDGFAAKVPKLHDLRPGGLLIFTYEDRNTAWSSNDILRYGLSHAFFREL